MGHHVTSLPAGATLPDAYGLPDGTALILGGVTWVVAGGTWQAGGGGAGGTSARYDASKSYAKGETVYVGGTLWAAYNTTEPGAFDENQWDKVGTLFDVQGVWDTSDPEDLPWTDAGGVYQFDGKLWRAITRDISTSKDPSTTATEPVKAAYVQVNGYSGTAEPMEGAYLAMELLIKDGKAYPNWQSEIHSATGIALYRTFPMGDDWTTGDVYRLVTKANFQAAQTAHSSVLDIPTVTTLTLTHAGTAESGDTSVTLAFAAPVDLAPHTNPDSPDFDGETEDRFVLITDRMDVAAYEAFIPPATPVGLSYGWVMTLSSATADDVLLSKDAYLNVEITKDMPAWELVFDPAL